MAATSVLWIRSLPPMSPLMVGFVRVTGAAILFLPWFLRHWRQRRPAMRDFRYSVLAGVALALHFGTWIASLAYTSVAHSVLLVATAPLFIIAISLAILRRPIARNKIVGAAIASGGILIIQWQAMSGLAVSLPGANPALGNLLALAGGLFAALYFMLGQEARQTLSTVLHVEVAYSTAAVVLLALSLAAGDASLPPWGSPWLFLGLLILLPTVGGHTIFNWGVRHWGAPVVSLFGLLEPVEASLLALIFLHESLGLATVLGGVVILAGLVVALIENKGLGQKV
jgi:drug/metabolite transporter (DMT)-like permease